MPSRLIDRMPYSSTSLIAAASPGHLRVATNAGPVYWWMHRHNIINNGPRNLLGWYQHCNTSHYQYSYKMRENLPRP